MGVPWSEGGGWSGAAGPSKAVPGSGLADGPRDPLSRTFGDGEDEAEDPPKVLLADSIQRCRTVLQELHQVSEVWESQGAKGTSHSSPSDFRAVYEDSDGHRWTSTQEQCRPQIHFGNV